MGCTYSQWVLYLIYLPPQVCLLVVNMQETSHQVVNHLRIMIEEAELLSTQLAKLFVMLLHFPPAQFFDHCYPSLFLKGWDHCYLDTVAHSAVQGVVDIQDWFCQCCCSKKASLPPEENSLLQALKGILPEAIPILSSRVLFGSSQDGSFNRPMNASQRNKALGELLFKKGVGKMLCQRFQSYWKPVVMTKYLKRAALFTKDCESTLNITDTIQTMFKSLFLDFLVYMLSQINEGFNLDVLFNSDSKDSDSSITLAVQELFLDIAQVLPLPKLSQLQFLSTNLQAPTTDHSPRFPFIKVVCEAMDRIVEQSYEDAQVYLLQEEETGSLGNVCFNIHDCGAIYANLQKSVMGKINGKFEVRYTPKCSETTTKS